MATNRGIVLANNYIYHVYNRGVERRVVYTNKREYERFIDTMRYYQYANPPIRYSKYLQQATQLRTDMFHELSSQPKVVDILSYCLMPNHFHLLIRQTADHGISKYISNLVNSYSKYFNTKHARVGPLFQGTFKAVLVETDEQLIHVSRYIHINPVASLVVPVEKLELYPWSSLPEYLNGGMHKISVTNPVLSHFSSIKQYRRFIYDQVDYGQTLEKMKHLHFEE